MPQLWTLDFLRKNSEINTQFICQAPVDFVTFRMHSNVIYSVITYKARIKIESTEKEEMK